MWQLGICDLRTIKLQRFADLRFADPIILCGLKTSAILQIYIIFSLQNKSLKCSHSNSRTTFGFGTGCDIAFRSLKYTTYVLQVKKYKRQTNEDPDLTNTAFFLSLLWILDLRTERMRNVRTSTPQKFADLRQRNEPKNFRICGPTKKICVPTFGSCSCNRKKDEVFKSRDAERLMEILGSDDRRREIIFSFLFS